MNPTLCQHCGARTELWICTACTTRLRQSLERLPWLANQLALTWSRQSKLTPGPTAARRRPATEDDEESPLPFVPAARERYDEIRTVAMRWVRDLSEQLGIAFDDGYPAAFIGPLPVGAVRGVASIAELSAWLLAHLDRLACSEDAGQALEEISDVADRALAAINRPVPPVYRGPCPTIVDAERGQPRSCGVPLYATRPDTAVSIGGDTVTCVRCGTQHDGRMLEQKLLAQLSGYLMPADEIQRVMRELGEPISKTTWHRWRAEGKLQPRAWRHQGRVVNYWLTSSDEQMFRLDDVRSLRMAGLEATTPRRDSTRV
ncbi:hypothetical protein L5I01_17430 [Gordonia sp. HY442]|uniref:hypothetical protein n=1 Tax=Gordonia zhenghanii TaxID=2911516 RepID=UPI001F295A45|nr:hypothetical protein [Gordonia zhenghanii]MCF8605139.1 hypothetical protein [Gordonia zhenghanii]